MLSFTICGGFCRPWLWTGDACMANASPTAVDSADAAKKREFIIAPLVVVRLGSRPTKLVFDRTHRNVTLGRKNFRRLSVGQRSPSFRATSNDWTKERWQSIAAAEASSPHGPIQLCSISVRQINRDAVPPVEFNPAMISAATLSPGGKRNGHAMGWPLRRRAGPTGKAV